MKVLLLDSVHPVLPEKLRKAGYRVDEDYISSKEAISRVVSQYQGLIIRSRFSLDADFLRHASELKFIGRVGAGLENIDVNFADSRGVAVLNAPEGNRDAVAEHAIGMLLALFNNLKGADTEVRNGHWKREENRGYELRGKTVGIVGFGNMGSALAEKLQSFNCRILAYDKYKVNYAPAGVEEVSLERLQAEADIVSLHIPQTEETLAMVDGAFLKGFGKSIYLINTARGKSLVTRDLVIALKEGKVKGACLDVLEYEKSSFENMFSQSLPKDFQFLVNSDKVLMSPHIAGWTHESNQRMAEVIFNKIDALKLL